MCYIRKNRKDMAYHRCSCYKILYFVQAQFLVFKRCRLFADKMTAASWGPVAICLGPVQCLRKCVHPGCKR